MGITCSMLKRLVQALDETLVEEVAAVSVVWLSSRLLLYMKVCLVGKRGTERLEMEQGDCGSDVILSERRGQSQKPEEVYELIEELVPNGKLLSNLSQIIFP